MTVTSGGARIESASSRRGMRAGAKANLNNYVTKMVAIVVVLIGVVAHVAIELCL